MYGHDAGMPKPGDPPGLVLELLDFVRRHIRATAQHFDGHAPVELGIMAQEREFVARFGLVPWAGMELCPGPVRQKARTNE